MARSLERLNQIHLLPVGDDWDDIAAPEPLDEAAASNNYGAQWRSFVNAARELGWSPDDLRERGTEAMAVALAAEGLRSWAPSTVTRYAKLARYAGVDPAPHPQPYTEELAEPDHRRLWTPRHHPTTQRNALAAVLTWFTALTLPDLLALPTGEVGATPTGGLRVVHEGEEVLVPVGAAALAAWEVSRRRWRTGPWLLCTTHPSKTGSPPGSQLSIRGFQASFAHHCALAGQTDLTWRRYRALAERILGDDGG